MVQPAPCVGEDVKSTSTPATCCGRGVAVIVRRRSPHADQAGAARSHRRIMNPPRGQRSGDGHQRAASRRDRHDRFSVEELLQQMHVIVPVLARVGPDLSSGITSQPCDIASQRMGTLETDIKPPQPLLESLARQEGGLANVAGDAEFGSSTHPGTSRPRAGGNRRWPIRSLTRAMTSSGEVAGQRQQRLPRLRLLVDQECGSVT